MEQGAEPVVLVPGLASDARVFAAQVAALSRGRTVQVACISEQTTVEDMARAVMADAPPRFALAGQGLGAAVALEVQRRAPERVARLALLAADCLSDTLVAAAAREEVIVAARTGRLGDALRKAVPPEALARPEVLPDLLRMARDLGPDVFVRQCRALQKRPDQQRTLRALRVPTLIVGGRRDTLCPPRRQDFMAAMAPAARLEILEEAGHLPTLEAPEQVAEAMLGWLDRQAPLILRRSPG